MGIWVDTDFGFDDLWALLVLQHLDVSIDAVSLVAGNAPLPQVILNACASMHTFQFDWPAYAGADKPIVRSQETADRILGKHGMQSRGRMLPYDSVNQDEMPNSESAIDAMADWLNSQDHPHILALGPLTNLALLLQQHAAAAERIEQITWLGGSRGRGNHSAFAEYNALADPEALSAVAALPCRLNMVDLELCRQVGFTESDMPALQGSNKQLLNDLLGGYLDIALTRGRNAMSIYDPLAALAVAGSASVEFQRASLDVTTEQNEEYGRTVISDADKHSNNESSDSNFEIAVTIDAAAAKATCLAALVNA